MPISIDGYYNRFDATKNYEQHLFRAGRVLQSAELNEIQSAEIQRTKMMGDALFKDGDVVRDARVVVNSVDGSTICESGAIYLRGQVRGIPSSTLTIPIDRSVAIGVWLIESTVTEVEDPTLRDPAAETRNYQEQGAARLAVENRWGYDQDGTPDGEFFPVYYADNGELRLKEAPPALDSVSQALARYDLDSTGSSYIVSGMAVTMLDDLSNGTQVYSIGEGRARVNGFGIQLNASRRLEYQATPDLRFIDSEPHTSTTIGAQRIDLDRPPVSTIEQVRITAENTATLVHGSFSGAQDPLPDTSVIGLIQVKQGATTYVNNVDYKLTGGRVDWSLSGAEPAPGSTYTAKYQYIITVTPTNVDDTGFTVTGAVVGTLVQTNYNVKLPRIDRLCLNQEGLFTWIRGVSTDYTPVRPPVPSNLIALCQVVQTWSDDRTIINDGVRVTSMSAIEGMQNRLDLLTDMIAQQVLKSDAGTREITAVKGLFVDPFINDNQRDIGLAQTGAIVQGALTLPIAGGVSAVTLDVTDMETCEYTLEPILSQTLRTGSMLINPYLAFGVIPAKVQLTPAVDRWVEYATVWTSGLTRLFTNYAFGGTHRYNSVLGVSVSNSTALVSTSTTEIQNLRQIEVKFTASGFGPGEILQSATFDGLAVTPTAL